MSSYRRGLAATANKQICGVDFSKQPNNEIWYITEEGKKINIANEYLIGQWGKQNDLQVVSHTYENGVGKIRYNVDVRSIGENFLYIDRTVLLVSLPRVVNVVNAYSFRAGVNYLIFLNDKLVWYLFKPNVLKALYVQPNCAQYYKNSYPNINIIEKKI